MSHENTNALIDESSPYLLQHAHNPVNWFPWGEEALEKARAEEKPILLSIGYSSCHWCHVMERESFEDQETARIMNERFVSVKVDREERPDLDAIYMDYVQMTTGHGGWPLTVFLTPEQVPFYGGTYFPPQDLPGRPSFRTVLTSVANFYGSEREQIEENRQKITDSLSKSLPLGGEKSEVDASLLQTAFQQLLRQVDHSHGGFGSAPKFPSSMLLGFLLRYHHRTGQQSALEAVDLSLEKMARGGIYDQLGGGFHRYAVDDRWLVPHFEKMLYDNALLVSTYLEAYQLTGSGFYREIVEETLRYVLRDLSHEGGGFFSAEDADSEGEEGRFYVWSGEEIRSLLGEEESALFCDYFDVTPGGNWEGKNILNQPRSPEEVAKTHGLTLSEMKQRLDAARQKLLEARTLRVRPGLDDKVLASWNGLMLKAMADAAFILDSAEFREAALKNARFLSREMIDSEGRIYRSWKDRESRFDGYLDDYAHVAEGFLSLYQATGDLEWLGRARRLTDLQIDLFLDEERGDFYFTGEGHERLVVRPKSHFDNAIPSGNSSAARNLLLLGKLTGEDRYWKLAERLLSKMSPLLQQHPSAFGNWLQALDFQIGPTREVVLIGSEEETRKLRQVVRELYMPNKILVLSSADHARAEEEVPLLEGRTDKPGQAFVCENFTCRQPTSDPADLRRQLSPLSHEDH